MKMISVCIITKDEEDMLPYCLSSVNWADEIIVVDSGSKDKTVYIAKKYGAKVFRKEWQGYVKQKNFAISKATGKWILFIDADEIVTDELKKEIIRRTNKNNTDAYLIKRKNYYYGKFLNFGPNLKDYQIKLFKKDKGKFEETFVHETVKIKGKLNYLKNPILHFTAENISEHIHTVNNYTELEVLNLKEKKYIPTGYSILLKWLFVFFKNYFLKGGFLDGFNGLIYNIISSYYVLIKEIKYAEIYGFKNINIFKTLFKR